MTCSAFTFDQNSFLILSHQIEVQIHSVGFNFRDILKTRVQITNLGSNENQSFTIGDRIFGKTIKIFTPKSYIVVDQYVIVQAPENLTMKQLCTILANFLTAIYALYEHVNLKSEQTVLIHTATEEKRKFLRDVYQIEYV
ncbi:unnamed protein product [Rotaria sp. Silwood2]|nr:unnamed protein product [Rotaria sp. Silwood2]